MLRFASCALAAVAVVALGSTADGAGVAPPIAALSQLPTQSSLASQRIYFVMPDRYANGSTADDQGGLLDLHPLLAVRRRLPQQQPLQDRLRGPGPLAQEVEADVGEVGAARDRPQGERDTLEDRAADFEPEQDRGEEAGDGREGVVEDRHLDEERPRPVGVVDRQLEGYVRPQRGAADHRALLFQVVEQRHHLPREQRHRVEPQVLGPVRAPVAEHVDRHHPVPPLRQLRRQAVEHVAIHQQPVRQHDQPLPLAVDVVGDPMPLVAELAHALHRTRANRPVSTASSCTHARS